MMVIDTSAWIELLADGPQRPKLLGLFPAPNELIVPTIVQLELCKWLTREQGEDKSDEILAFTQTCMVEPLDTKIAVHAAELCATRKLATADAVIYATALRHGARLLTCEAHFDGLADVDYIAKTPH